MIEHLPAATFKACIRSLFQSFRPGMLVITTPNHTFNQFFPDEMPFADPSGRTNRRFRHHDHQFEWTGTEFRDWATEAAREHGYAVEFSGVGIVPRPKKGRSLFERWRALSESGHRVYATQIAVFVRAQAQQTRFFEDDLTAPASVQSGGPPAMAPRLLHTREFGISHPALSTPVLGMDAYEPAGKEIAEIVKYTMLNILVRDDMTLDELWASPEVRIAAKGVRSVILDQLEAHKRDFEMQLDDEEGEGEGGEKGGEAGRDGARPEDQLAELDEEALDWREQGRVHIVYLTFNRERELARRKRHEQRELKRRQHGDSRRHVGGGEGEGGESSRQTIAEAAKSWNEATAESSGAGGKSEAPKSAYDLDFADLRKVKRESQPSSSICYCGQKLILFP